MEDFSKTLHIDDEAVHQRLAALLNTPNAFFNRKSTLMALMGFADLTSLEGSDTKSKIIELCEKGLSVTKHGFPAVAAVCVYPTLVKTARKALEGSGIKVAAVAGAFPAGQSPIHIKTAEVRYTVDEGADEIDMVISRGKFLEGEYNLVFDEIAAIKEACGKAHLKVILETGELKSATNIRRASEIAIKAGGDFIKTSTGKIQPAATLHAMLVMLEAISDHKSGTGKMVGIKPAGGIADPDMALQYYTLVEKVVGKEWLTNEWFRIGASRLVDNLIEEVLK